MKLLKIDNNLGHFLDKSGMFQPIDRITKEDLLSLVDLTLNEEVEFDEYDEEKIGNQAHQIIYKSIHEKLRGLRDRKQEFIIRVGSGLGGHPLPTERLVPAR